MTGPLVAIYRGRERIEAIAPDDRALAYGDGLFETLLVHGGQPVWWPAHRQRLARGASVLGIAMPGQAWLEARIAEVLEAAPQRAVLKLVLSRGVGGRGYAADADAEPTLMLSLHATPASSPPLNLRWCRTRVAIQPALAGIKHLNRLEQVLARAEWDDPDIHDGLMLDTEDQLACATSANVFARIDGRWLTPPVQRRGIAGIARAWILANEADALEAELDAQDIASAESLFLCNAVRGILPVASLGEKRWALHPALVELRRRLGRSEPAFEPGS